MRWPLLRSQHVRTQRLSTRGVGKSITRPSWPAYSGNASNQSPRGPRGARSQTIAALSTRYTWAQNNRTNKQWRKLLYLQIRPNSPRDTQGLLGIPWYYSLLRGEILQKPQFGGGFMGGPNVCLINPRLRSAAILKKTQNCDTSTAVRPILVILAPYSRPKVKISNFWKSRMAAAGK